MHYTLNNNNFPDIYIGFYKNYNKFLREYKKN